MGIDKIIDVVNSAFESAKPAANVLPSELLWCCAVERPGGSSVKTSAEIIYNWGLVGGDTGPNPDGTPNMVNEFIYAVVDGVHDMISKDMVTDVATPAGIPLTLIIPGTGAIEAVNGKSFTSRGFTH